MFKAPPTAPIDSLEFLGNEKPGPILFQTSQGPRSLPYNSWRILDFDRRTGRIHLVYVNPGNPSFPPSFVLKGEGRHTRLVVGGQTYTGELACGLW
ncbi:hypothetical protein EYQ95_24735 [Lysobacter sp. N42]|nr:hypothetical protein EYQ95_24735 [Lysobacter sp. N42]